MPRQAVDLAPVPFDDVVDDGRGPYALRVSLPCAPWLVTSQHERCQGFLLAGNKGPRIPCGCACHDEPAQRGRLVAVTSAAASR